MYFSLVTKLPFCPKYMLIKLSLLHTKKVDHYKVSLSLRADHPPYHRLDDLMCRDAEYLPALLGQPSDREQYRVDREREREKDLQNFKYKTYLYK